MRHEIILHIRYQNEQYLARQIYQKAINTQIENEEKTEKN